MFDGADGVALQKDLQEFLDRPEHRDALGEQQKEEFLQLQEFREKELETSFIAKLMQCADPFLQKRLRPFLRHSVLRRLLMSIANSAKNTEAEDGALSYWLSNPRVLQMFTEAERLLSKGRVKEEEMEQALLSFLSQSQRLSFQDGPSPTVQAKSIALSTEALLKPLQEHVEERKKGNDAFHRKDFSLARHHYERSLSVLEIIRGTHAANQKEVNHCRGEVRLNLAAVSCATEEYGAAIRFCTSVLEADPDNIKALIRRGKAYKRRHETVLAREDLQRVAELQGRCQNV